MTSAIMSIAEKAFFTTRQCSTSSPTVHPTTKTANTEMTYCTGWNVIDYPSRSLTDALVK